LNNARKGFLEYPQFLRLLAELPANLRDPVSFLYHSGWRVSEMRKIEWLHLDGATLVLPSELSKSNHARRLPLEGELAEIIQRAREHRRLEQPRIFHRNGRPIGDFRKLWQKACVAVGLGHWIEENDDLREKPKWKIRKKYRGLIVHDLRRSCVRNLVRSGLSEKIAMDQTGHKTRSVFERYNIVNDRDRIEAQQRYQAYLAEQQRQAAAVAVLPREQTAKFGQTFG
jgi:integrase